MKKHINEIDFNSKITEAIRGILATTEEQDKGIRIASVQTTRELSEDKQSIKYRIVVQAHVNLIPNETIIDTVEETAN